MSFKDPEQRNEYQRRYMQQYRTNPLLRERERAQARQRYSNGQTKRSSSRSRRPFAGVDGEGATLLCEPCRGLLETGQPYHGCRKPVPGGYCGQHRYVLLRAGEQVLIDDAGLDWKQIFPWVTGDLAREFEYVSFFFDYDVTMMLRSAPWDRIVELVKTGKAWFGEYFVTYMPRREFKVTRMVCTDGKWAKAPLSKTFTVSDTCTLFQTAFVNVINAWEALTPDLREKIAEGKTRRAVVAHVDGELIVYNRLECDALADTMEKVRDAADALELHPRKWQGPGYLTNSMFSNNDVPRRDRYEERMPPQVVEAGRSAYYGGRFEVKDYGFVGECVEADIASAYPHALVGMPCIEHAQWRHTNGADTGGVRTPDFLRPRLLRVRAAAREPALFYGLPYRDRNGGVWWPGAVEGWYWDFEVAQAKHQNIEVLEAWEWVPQCDHRPFEFLEELFLQRKAMGKSARGKVLKLAMNSAYGKLAQTVGSPVYASHVMASYITAHCRTRISAAIHAHGCGFSSNLTGLCGSNVAMIATDALFVRGSSFLLPTGSRLGDWETKEHGDLFIVQAGVYFFGELQVAAKTRGTPVKLIAQRRGEFEEAFRALASGQGSGDVYVPVQRFVGLRDAVHRGNAARLGSFVWLGAENDPAGKRIGFDWVSKRHGLPLRADPGGVLTTRPRDGEVPGVSHAYPKRVPALLEKHLDDSPEYLGQLGLF